MEQSTKTRQVVIASDSGERSRETSIRTSFGLFAEAISRYGIYVTLKVAGYLMVKQSTA